MCYREFTVCVIENESFDLPSAAVSKSYQSLNVIYRISLVLCLPSVELATSFQLDIPHCTASQPFSDI